MVEQIVLTKDEAEKFSRWIAANVTADVVPIDEGNDDGLIYNLLSLINGWDDKYDYKDAQHEVLMRYGVGYQWWNGNEWNDRSNKPLAP